MEGNIFLEIREFEKKAEEIVEKANKEKEAIMQRARLKASKLLMEKNESIEKDREKRISSFIENLRQSKEKKISEGKLNAEQLKKQASKKMNDAVEFVLKKFEEMV